MMKFILPVFGLFLHLTTTAQTITDTIAAPSGMYAEGIPSLPASLASSVRPYTEFRAASLLGWHGTSKSIFISTRFGNSNQIHQVNAPLGDRKQLTFEADAPREFSFQPNQDRFFFFTRDSGGNEFNQIYKYNLGTGQTTRLTFASKSVHNQLTWHPSGKSFLYMATVPGSSNREVHWMNAQTHQQKTIASLTGSGWGIADWNTKQKQILMNRSVSINESSIWIMNDSNSGGPTRILPKAQERTIYQALRFSKDGQFIYLLTNKGKEFTYLARLNVKTGVMSTLFTHENGDVQSVDFNTTHSHAALVVNVEGYSKLMLLDLKTKKATNANSNFDGTISRVQWHPVHAHLLAVTKGYYKSANDVHVYDMQRRQWMRWTESELGGMPLQGLSAPALIRWKSFDQRSISGFLYRANPLFTGKRPVIIQIHGGPEGQSLPVFAGKNNYFLQELGVHLIYPNVRGSTGYGKSFADLDNGFNRENSVKDIGALLDWISEQPDMDASLVMVTGGSYGGYMTLASAVYFSDRLRCALDVVGISHFKTFLERTEPYRKDLRRVEYGDERDTAMAAFFEKISPLNQTEKIKIPLCIVQGKNDPRVPYSESEQMVRKVRANGSAPVWYLLSDNEGHGFAKKSNQDFQFYATIMFVRAFLLGIVH